ncbi:MAG: hypothetical protein KF836_12265 [Fimbriimonadaceae bacterium]|nr:hypothetical protein [Fimbriimonadaceae bacterium]
MTLMLLLGQVVFHLFDTGRNELVIASLVALIFGVLSLESGYKALRTMIDRGFKTKCKQFEVSRAAQWLLYAELICLMQLVLVNPFALGWEPVQDVYPMLFIATLMSFCFALINRKVLDRLNVT